MKESDRVNFVDFFEPSLNGWPLYYRLVSEEEEELQVVSFVQAPIQTSKAPAQHQAMSTIEPKISSPKSTLVEHGNLGPHFLNPAVTAGEFVLAELTLV